ncbi:MAG: ABC transporter permease [Bacteroidales bacterium]|nr:ABC transporter permease [Bacteroidales bacterium]
MNNIKNVLILRGILKLVRQPAAPLMGFGMSLFFLIVYNAGIGGIGNMEVFGAGGYLAFIFPITIISLSMGSSAGAGQTLNDDMQSGYFRRLYLSPAPRWMLVISPMLADTLSSILFSGILLVIGAIFGLPFRFGIISISGILLISALWSVTLCGLSAGVMLRSGKHQNVSLVTNTVFILLFLSTTFLPRELITSKWLLFVSMGNPVTYILEACRYLLGGTSSLNYFIISFVILLLSSSLSIAFALGSVKKIKL